jgi:CubicO group peptidase (beta-lactamase class C family)
MARPETGRSARLKPASAARRVLPVAPRVLPGWPSLRHLKLEAKRRVATGEFAALWEAQLVIAREHGLPSWRALRELVARESARASRALPHLRWVESRFRESGKPGWMPPDAHELRQHFTENLLGRVASPSQLIETITGVAADLREGYTFTAVGPLTALIKSPGRRLMVATVEANPPHLVDRARSFPLRDRIDEVRGIAAARAEAAPRAIGDSEEGGVPPTARKLAAGAVAELGLPGLVLAGGGPQSPPWVIAEGWADLDRAEALTTSHRFPAARVTRLVIAIAVLRLVADGAISLSDPVDSSCTVADLLAQSDMVRVDGYAAMCKLIADVTGLPPAAALACLILDPLRMNDSAFQKDPGNPDSPGSRPGLVTGYRLDHALAFAPVSPARAWAGQAVGGMATTGADLVRFGTGWPSLLPEELAREALRPQGSTAASGLRMGHGWSLGPNGKTAGISGTIPGAFASLIIRVPDWPEPPTACVVLTNRQLPIVDLNLRLLQSVAP